MTATGTVNVGTTLTVGSGGTLKRTISSGTALNINSSSGNLNLSSGTVNVTAGSISITNSAVLSGSVRYVRYGTVRYG
jgi:hypothetical protein